MIKNEDNHKISEEIKERAQFYGLYNVHTKNKMSKFLLADLKQSYEIDEQDRTELVKTVHQIDTLCGEQDVLLTDMSDTLAGTHQEEFM